MKLILESPFDFKNTHFADIEMADRIRVKERRLMEKLGTLSETDGLVSLCASICDLTEDVFDQLGDEDFEKIAQHALTLLEKRAEKKSAGSDRKRRDRNRKGRSPDAQGVRVHRAPDA